MRKLKSKTGQKRKNLILLLTVLMFISMIPGTIMFVGTTGPSDQIIFTGGDEVYEGGDVVVSKKIRHAGEENEFFIDLTVSTKDLVDAELFQKANAAVVLVVDVSTSMRSCAECSGTNHLSSCSFWRSGSGGDTVLNNQTRIYAAVEAAKDFLKEFRVADDALGEKRYASLVFFGTSADVIVGWSDITNNRDNDPAFFEFTSRLNPAMGLQGGTFAQGGLLLARNLFSTANAPKVNGSPITNRYVVLLTDGDPNSQVNEANISTYVNGYTSTNIPFSATTTPVSGNQYIAINRPPTATAASQIKNGVSGQTYSAELFTIAFQTNSGFTLGGIDYPSADVWLRDDVSSGPDYAYYADDTLSLNLAFDDILTSIRTFTHIWRVYDPMAENIEFLGVALDDGTLANGVTVTSDGRNTFSYNSGAGTITWDMLTSNVFLNNGDQKVFKLTYKIRVDNITEVCYGNAPNGVDTNLRTYLVYVLASQDAATGELLYSGTPKEVGFQVPKVRSFNGGLTFTKVDQFDNTLSKAFEFTLAHAADCPCGITAAYTRNVTNSNGQVSFSNIPSGHKYVLTESGNPATTMYVTNTAQIPVYVNYGDVTCTVNGGKYINTAREVPVALWKFFNNAGLSLFGMDGELVCRLHVHDQECYDESLDCDRVGLLEEVVEYCEGGDVLGEENVFIECGCPRSDQLCTRSCEGECEIFVAHDCAYLECEDECPGGDYITCDGNCVISEMALVISHIDGCEGGCWEDVNVLCNGDCVTGASEKLHVCSQECKLICEEPTHAHGHACYVKSELIKDTYEFAFTIAAAGSDWTETRKLTLTREMIIDLIDPDSGIFLRPLVINEFFTIPARELSNGPFIISETVSDLGWVVPTDAEIKLNNVTSGPVTTLLNNEYGNVKRPWFTITKELDIGRGSNSETFYFGLYDEDEVLLKTVSVSKSNGYKALVALDNTFLDADGRVLTLKEEINDEPTPGMVYDSMVYSIRINNGVAAIDGVTGSNVEFFNYYFEPVIPEFTIQKTTNNQYNGSFIFDYSYDGHIWGVGFEDTVEGSGSVTINTNEDGFLAEVKLTDLTNFSGSFTVKERSGTAGSRWEYDHTVYLLTFENGILVDKSIDGSPVEDPTDVIGFSNIFTPASNTVIRRETATDSPVKTLSDDIEIPDVITPHEELPDLPDLPAGTAESMVDEEFIVSAKKVQRSIMPKSGLTEEMGRIWKYILFFSGVISAILCLITWYIRKKQKRNN